MFEEQQVARIMERLCSSGPTALAALIAASVLVSRLGHAYWFGSDHAPRCRMPSTTMCMPGVLARMYASSARILGPGIACVSCSKREILG